MSEPTLVILAAGLSTRYGSPKQIEPVGPDGEFIIDYSVYDAVRAGFKRVVFLIAPGMLEDFEAAIAAAWPGMSRPRTPSRAWTGCSRRLHRPGRAASAPGAPRTPCSAAARWWTAPSP